MHALLPPCPSVLHSSYLHGHELVALLLEAGDHLAHKLSLYPVRLDGLPRGGAGGEWRVSREQS